MSSKWQDILDRAGDADLGATLVRLARMAERVHQAEAARTIVDRDAAKQRITPTVGADR